MKTPLKKVKGYLKDKILRFPSLSSNPLAGFFIKKYYNIFWSSKDKIVHADILGIENTNICNASCHMCGYRLMKRPKVIMPYDDFCRMIDIARREGIRRVCFGQVGEPLTDKELVKKIDYMHKSGMELDSITTNASLLNKEIAAELLQYPWRMFMFSIDAVTKETYESIRQGLSYERVIENVRAFLQLRKEANHQQMSVRLNMVVYEKNKHEEEEFFNAWKDYLLPGKDDIAFLYAVNFGGLVNFNDNRLRSVRIPCGRLWNNLIMVSVTGDIVLCCGDYEAGNNIGNIFKENSIKKLWNNLRMQEFRKLHIKGEFDKIPICINCNDNYFVKPYFKIRPV